MRLGFEEIPFDVYRALPGCSNTALSRIKERSPAYAKWSEENESLVSSDAATLGSLVHVLLLEPTKFSDRFAILPPGHGSTKVVKEAKAAALDEGLIPVKKETVDKATAIFSALQRSTAVRKLLEAETRSEVSAFWERDGVQCKGRYDILAGNVIADLKVSAYASPSKFARHATNYGLHRQAAWYLDGALALDREVDAFAWIVVESTAPFEVAVYVPTADALRAGREEARQLFEIYRRCVETGEWPGYGNEIREVDVPDWELRRLFPEEMA